MEPTFRRMSLESYRIHLHLPVLFHSHLFFGAFALASCNRTMAKWIPAIPSSLAASTVTVRFGMNAGSLGTTFLFFSLCG